MKKLNKQKGITLIALVITIIVMLILVAVTISMAINGGLFGKAGKATGDTRNAMNAEQALASGQITIDGKTYASIDDYLAGKEAMLTYDEATKENGFLTVKARYESDGKIAIIPKGFKIIEDAEGKKSIDAGLVIQDKNGNEFVWVPVTNDLGSSYSSETGYSEPRELTDTWADSTNTPKPKYDSQEILDELYESYETENPYTYSEDFKYADEYAEMVRCVNANDGFYIGRYETTVDDEGNIGSKYNTTVLTAARPLFTTDSANYPYCWYGLYYVSKNANVTGNGTDVQTAMIYGVLYDKAMDFIRTQKAAGKTTYDVDSSTASWHGSANGHTGVVNSGQANSGDVALNIWDLESNALEWTQEAFASDRRGFRGGYYYYSYSASYHSFSYYPTYKPTTGSSRIALYIK